MLSTQDRIGSSLPPAEEMYRAIVARDATYEGVFITAVRTTGIFCRPTCAARKPRRENVEFFCSVRDALSAGYRPCQRCRPLEPRGATPPWLRGLLAAIEREPARRWTDGDLRALDLDPARVRRWFKKEHGMTFHTYQRTRRLGLALGCIRHGEDLTGAAYDHGYESLSGFREAFQRLFGETPGRGRGRVVPVVVTRLMSPLGPLVAAATDEGVCLLEFADRRMLETQIGRLRQRLGGAVFTPGSNPHIELLDEQLAAYFSGELHEFTVPLVVPGTDFQQAVWERLRAVPYGSTSTYERLAREIERPGAQRAVGRANGDNRLAIVIPCHRIVRSDGTLCGYGGGLWRKQRLLELERAHLDAAGGRAAADQPFANGTPPAGRRSRTQAGRSRKTR